MTEDLVLEHLRAIRADIADIKSAQFLQGERLTAVERHLAALIGAQPVLYSQMSDFEKRLQRIERRLDLVE